MDTVMDAVSLAVLLAKAGGEGVRLREDVRAGEVEAEDVVENEGERERELGAVGEKV